MVMDGTSRLSRAAAKQTFSTGTRRIAFPPTKVDRVLHDGDEVQLGGVVLVAHKTPGHTKGCTTWTLKVVTRARTTMW